MLDLRNAMSLELRFYWRSSLWREQKITFYYVYSFSNLFITQSLKIWQTQKVSNLSTKKWRSFTVVHKKRYLIFLRSFYQNNQSFIGEKSSFCSFFLHNLSLFDMIKNTALPIFASWRLFFATEMYQITFYIFSRWKFDHLPVPCNCD